MHILLAALIALFAFTGTAFAASDTSSISDVARPVLDAIMSGKYWYAAALGLVLIFAAVKRYGAKKSEFLQSDAGISMMLFGTSFGLAMANKLAAGGAPTLGMAYASSKLALIAAGGYKLVLKPFVVPLLHYAQKKAPFWMSPLFSTLLWPFESAQRIKDAGDDAVRKDPPSGAAGVVGEPRDIS